MKKNIVIGSILLVTGAVLVIVGLSLGASTSFYVNTSGIHFGANSGKMVQKEVLIEDEVTQVVIDADVGNVIVTKGDEVKYEHKSPENAQVGYSVSGDTATIESEYENRFFGINFGFLRNNFDDGDTYLKVSIPSTVKSVEIRNDVGETEVYSIENLDKFVLVTDVGEANVENINADFVKIDTNVGDVEYKDSISENLEINSEVGQIEADNIDTNDMIITSDVGNIEVSMLKLNGDLNVTTDVGKADVEIVGNVQDYNIEASATLGVVEVNGDKIYGNYTQKDADKNISIVSGIGSASLKFTQD